MKDAICKALVKIMPARLMYWAAVRILHATIDSRNGHVRPNDVGFVAALLAWHVRHMGPPDVNGFYHV